MLLGKRPYLAMRRTASLTELSHDPAAAAEKVATGPLAQASTKRPFQQKLKLAAHGTEAPLWLQRNHRRHSGDFAAEAAHFLRECGLCRKQLGPGKDTFMYRGEMAFCSLECRQQQMTLEERKEKCSAAS